MPNWCNNTLTVTGPESAVEDFRAASTTDGDHLSFNRLVPVPQDDDRLGTATRRWGTKWDLEGSDEIVFDQPGAVGWRFNTAWSPPTEWLLAAAKQFPDVTFVLEYDEGGCDFAGRLTIAGGETDPDNSFEGSSYSWNPCGEPDCDESTYGNGPGDEDFGSAPAAWFCPEHQLIQAVAEAVAAE